MLDLKFEAASTWMELTYLLTYVYGTSAAEAEDQQVKDEARLQVVHGVDGPRARGHRTLITASAKTKFQKKKSHTRTNGSWSWHYAEQSDSRESVLPNIKIGAGEGWTRGVGADREGDGETRRERRKRVWKRPFRPPCAFRRGEMARFSYRTDIRPVQEPRTKSYIHASSHYASLSRLGSAVRRERKRRKERGPLRMLRVGERATEDAVGLFGWFFSRMRGGENACVPDTKGIPRRFRGEGECGTTLYSRRCRRDA